MRLPLFSLLALPVAFGSPLMEERAEQSAAKSILPSGYAKISLSQSRAKITSFTKESIQSLLRSVNTRNGQFLGGAPDSLGLYFFWQSVNAWTSIAQSDLQQKSKVFYGDYKTNQDKLAKDPGHGFEKWGVQLCNDYNDDCGWAGLDALTGYEAYGDDIFLKMAVGIWDFISAHGYIDQAAIKSGYLVGTKNADNKIAAQCKGKSMLGGVYWMSVADSPDVNAVSTGNYGLLSVELCRLTGDMKYCDRAYQTAWWLDNHMVTSDGLLWDHYNGKTCELKDWVLTYNTGLYIALYAELGYVTKNTTATKLAERSTVAAMKAQNWNTAKGINKEGEGPVGESDNIIGFKSIMIRYLAKVHPWLADVNIKAAILQYINIQYWALTSRASDNPAHPVNYGRNWTGPAYTKSSVHAQLAALDVLNAVQLNPDSAFGQ